MKLHDLPLDLLQEAPWNPNVADHETREKVKRSITRFGVVENLVVRPQGDGYEVLSGNQRLRIYRELGLQSVPCVVVKLDDARAKLLAQAMNRTRGEDDLGLKAALVRDLLEHLPQEEVLSLLPETVESLRALTSMGTETIADGLRAWQQAQSARLRHLTFQLTPDQLPAVEAALRLFSASGRDLENGNPNPRGNALYLLCKAHLAQEETR
ncbi:MAG: ParB N-terminal domain-containing protein [Chloroflexi bacterium]|nr:ParB N-terminal domain-containing protein [Chloroflexota bacterium]